MADTIQMGGEKKERYRRDIGEHVHPATPRCS
jgi:hypothetical protein